MFIFIDAIPLLKEIKSIRTTCNACNRVGEIKLMKSYHCLRLFFLPIWKWNVHYYLLHEACGVQVEISEEDAILIQYKDKNPSSCQVINSIPTQLQCDNCGEILENSYDYCPYCGQKTKKYRN